MKMTCDFGNTKKRICVGDGIDRFYLEDGDKRMVFTTDGEYMYTYNYVNPIWE